MKEQIMKILTTISVVLEHADGTNTLMSREFAEVTGDNPRFHRTDVRTALENATSGFVDIHGLNVENKKSL